MENTSRTERFQGRAALRSITSNPRCEQCGYRSVLPGGNVALRKTSPKEAASVVGFAGLTSCGSVWLCPVCNAKIMARRAIEVGACLVWAQQTNLIVLWGALTIRHNAFTSLKGLIAMQTEAWRRVTQRREWTSYSATQRVPHKHDHLCKWLCAFDHETHDDGCEWHCPRVYDTARKVDENGVRVKGRVGYIRASEINYGSANGWHPHFHPVILIDGDKQEAEWFAADVVAAWREAVEHLGGEAYEEAQSLEVVEGVEIFDRLTGYVTKATYDTAKLAMETTWQQGKKGRGRVKETRSHWSLLVDVANGLADEVGRWGELEEAVPGHRAITWSRGLRSFAGLNDEPVKDEDIAGEEVGSKEDTVVMLTARGWAGVRDNPVVMGLLLTALEESWEALANVLDFYGIEYGAVDDLGDVNAEQYAGFAEDKKAEEYEEWFVKVSDGDTEWGEGPASEPILWNSRGLFDPNVPLPPTW
jgi:hypothetical protein